MLIWLPVLKNGWESLISRRPLPTNAPPLLRAPLAMALSSTVRPRLYTPAERENGKAAWLLGLSFISEGAIPFAAADPLRGAQTVLGFSAHGVIDRTQWGVNDWSSFAGNDVQLIIEVELVRAG